MAESGTPGGQSFFRDPSTGRFISRETAVTRGGIFETTGPGGSVVERTEIFPLPILDPFERSDGANSTLITRTADAPDDWLRFVEPPIDRDVTEFRFVVEDSGYDSGFRTTSPFSADESPADVAERLGISAQVVRIVYGISQ